MFVFICFRDSVVIPFHSYEHSSHGITVKSVWEVQFVNELSHTTNNTFSSSSYLHHMNVTSGKVCSESII